MASYENQIEVKDDGDNVFSDSKMGKMELDDGMVAMTTGAATRRRVRRKVKIPAKTCAAAGGLLIVGVILLGVALDFFVNHPHHEGTIPMLVIAAIALCPGVYSSVNIYGAYRGWRGYSMDQLPSYDQL
uniref:Transmembrane protein 230 n=1 Tax=Florenciella parvula TaxID=236787 RepID=A0A7S2G805_9STRA|mmetsp:Transcript_5488/g.11215  ORF Transcript_5488/g.11215 Transcript_5488/m.11215 type:complete len:129 (+) Transcript_5488:266-652(+)